MRVKSRVNTEAETESEWRKINDSFETVYLENKQNSGKQGRRFIEQIRDWKLKVLILVFVKIKCIF